MSAYIGGLQAELSALNLRRAPLLALVASDGFAALSDRQKATVRTDNNLAAVEVASLEARILAAPALPPAHA